MADHNPTRTLSAAFPTPPPFYTHFTAENLRRSHEIRKESRSAIDSPSNAVNGESLPEELHYLEPPNPPADGRYKSFGTQHNLHESDQSLAAAGIQQLYPAQTTPNGIDAQSDPTAHMLTLTRSILLNFLELVGILSVNPAHCADKIEHIQTLFYNVHDLINQYRPHQARESLVLMLEEQVDKIRSEIDGVRDGKEKMQALLRTVQESGVASQVASSKEHYTNGEHPTEDGKVLARREAQKRQWAALDDELG